MKKITGWLYLGILIFSSIILMNPNFIPNAPQEAAMVNPESSSETSLASDISMKMSSTDPRGWLTGRFFYAGLNDTPVDGYSDTLMIDVEVTINKSSANGYYIIAQLNENRFQKKYYNVGTDEWNIEYGMHIYGNSTYQTPLIKSTGKYNITVHFNCSQLRALKTPGPFQLVWVQLEEWTVSSVDQMDSFDQEDPLLWISEIPDINSFQEPKNTGGFTLHDAQLVTDFLEVNITFHSFQTEWYYIRLVLRDASSKTIAHYEESFSVPWDSTNDVKLQIRSKYLAAFNDFYGSFTGNQDIYFEEVTIVELNSRWGWRDTYNISYESSPYSANINVDLATPVTVLKSGERWDYGTMNVNDSVQFISYPQNSDDVLYLDVNRTEPSGLEYGLSNFEIRLLDGWGRQGDPWYNNFVIWDDWSDWTQTNHFMGHLGKYFGPWLFEVKYPDSDSYTDAQDLAIEVVKIEEDTLNPSFSLSTPADGAQFSQYYGIPIKGTQSDDSYVLWYSILLNDEYVFYMRRTPMHGRLLGDEVSFVFFPPSSYTGKYRMTIRAMDLTRKISDTEITITINSGTIPTPESTIEKGLEWLRNQQHTSDPSLWDYGSWDYIPGEDWGKEGMTALAAACFIQAGLSDDPVVENAVDFLRGQFQIDSEISGTKSIHGSSYETAMATIALIAYNATLPDYDLGLDLLIDDAVEWLVESQNDETWGVQESDPWYGGWRYGHDHQSSDLSVSQWVILALATSGYDPESPLWDKVDTFVRRCKGIFWETDHWEYDGGFTYTPSTEDWRDQGGSSYGSMTAAGIWGLYLSGSQPNDSDIISALDWIDSQPLEQLIGKNPHYSNDFEYYWYLSASKAFLMAGRPQDEWWYDNITHYLNTHMIAETSSPTAAYWDNTRGQEPPVYATVQAILSQQVFYGEVPTHKLEVSLEAEDSGSIYLWNSTISVGYNYTTGLTESSSGTTYSGLLAKTQSVEVLSPSKGEYFVDIFPAAGRGGISIPQDLVLQARALSESGHILEYTTRVINYQYASGTQVRRFKLILSTVAGVNVLILDEFPPVFTHTIDVDDVSCPIYVEPEDSVSVSVTMSNLGVGTINDVEVFSEEDLVETSSSSGPTNWAENTRVTMDFEYSTSGLPVGKKTIVIGLIASDTNPVLVYLKVQVGNHVPEGTLNTISGQVSGTITISWTASDQDDDPLEFKVILEKPDGSRDILAEGLTATSYSFDTTAYTDGTGYRIIIELSDGIDTKELVSDFFEIRNRKSDPNITPSWSILLTVFTLGFVMLYLNRKK